MKSTYYTYDTRPVIGLQVTAVRYTPDVPPNDGLTLIVAHANSTHKETWVTLLAHLFDLAAASPSVKILEAWSIECPSHGESAVLNEREMATLYADHWDGWIYPRAMHAFLESRPDGVNFYDRKLVTLGHSQGGNSLVLLHDLQPTLPIQSFILLDPTIAPEGPHKDRLCRVLTFITWTHTDTWPSRKAAHRHLSQQPGYRNWHPDVLDAFIEKGIRTHPAAAYPPPYNFDGVTLALTKQQESALTRANGHNARAWAKLHELYESEIPVHIILSREDEFGGSKPKEETFGLQSDKPGERIADSIQWIEKGGHMFVQTMPIPTANAVWAALTAADKHAPVLVRTSL